MLIWMDGLNLEQIWQELKLRVKEYSRCSGQNISAVLPRVLKNNLRKI
jgi:hypothetical protein